MDTAATGDGGMVGRSFFDVASQLRAAQEKVRLLEQKVEPIAVLARELNRRLDALVGPLEQPKAPEPDAGAGGASTPRGRRWNFQRKPRTEKRKDSVGAAAEVALNEATKALTVPEIVDALAVQKAFHVLDRKIIEQRVHGTLGRLRKQGKVKNHGRGKGWSLTPLRGQ